VLVIAAANRADTDAPPRPQSAGGESILVVEDEPDMAVAMAELLRDQGYQVLLARHGREALDLLERQEVDLIVLDLRLPVMDGWQFRTAQRAHPRLSRIPVIAVSADGSAQAEAIDASGYLRKPFKSEQLLLVIERALLGEQRKDLAKKLREVERLTTLGTIAASVGHEINNPLTYVFGNLHVLQTRIRAIREQLGAPQGDPLGELTELLAEIRVGAERIRSVVEMLQKTSRRADDDLRWLDVNTVAKTAIAIAWNEIRHHARLRTEFSTLPAIFASEARLGQVFVNLLVNAAQSITAGAPEQNEIVVRTAAAPDHVVIEVSDTGVGIPKELQPRIFEPFFTTKAPNVGTGIGLTISRNIVAEHGGRIELQSRPGSGTTFRVLLPLRRAGGA
jgi:signal transduction histidine kinase